MGNSHQQTREKGIDSNQAWCIKMADIFLGSVHPSKMPLSSSFSSYYFYMNSWMVLIFRNGILHNYGIWDLCALAFSNILRVPCVEGFIGIQINYLCIPILLYQIWKSAPLVDIYIAIFPVYKKKKSHNVSSLFSAR
ncbi:hypothetical protein GLOIN_2v1727569 [Rhizophagus irregularis DAOM 181602=DAOM 197198]|nr:hypothetical protein GLOIN_2v1727569 [Rhizophagus irregularis DAOM 181602=DAOM 197198]